MSQRGPLTAIVTTALGLALGGLLVWRVYRTKRKRASSFQRVAIPPAEALPEEGAAAERGLSLLPGGQDKDEISRAVACQSTVPPPADWLPWSEQLLATKPQTVSSENEWLQLWPQLQEELSVFPVLGFDCEWVKSKALREKYNFFMFSFPLFTKKGDNPILISDNGPIAAKKKRNIRFYWTSSKISNVNAPI